MASFYRVFFFFFLEFPQLNANSIDTVLESTVDWTKGFRSELDITSILQ